jgi:hypothetical protein
VKLPLLALLLAALAFSPRVMRAEERADRPMSAVVTAGEARVTSSLDKATASVAEPIQLKLVVEAPQGSRVEWPALDKKLGSLDLIRVKKLNDVPLATGTNLREWVLQLTLDSIKTGDLAIPPIDIRYAPNADAEFQSVPSSPLQIHISSVLEDRADPTRFRDIKETVDVPVAPPSSKRWVYWAGGTATALALLLVAFAVKRRSRGIAPVAWALASIEEIERLDPNEADVTSRFKAVVDIIREYLGLEFGVDTLTQTTSEFLSGASAEIDLPSQTTERVKWLAAVADEIKFARLDVGAKHFDQAVAQAKALVAECDQHRRAVMKGAA